MRHVTAGEDGPDDYATVVYHVKDASASSVGGCGSAQFDAFEQLSGGQVVPASCGTAGTGCIGGSEDECKWTFQVPGCRK